MPPFAETLLVALITQAVQLVPTLIKQFADPLAPNPPPPDVNAAETKAAVQAIAAAVAHGIAAAAYQASLDRPHIGRQEDLPPLPKALPCGQCPTDTFPPRNSP